MSYDAKETSRESGRPVELFDFVLGDDQYHFTTEDKAMTWDSTDYTPLEITREQIALGPEEQTNILTLTLPSSHLLVRRYINQVPGARAGLTIRRLHRTDSIHEIITLFKGVVRSVSFSDKGASAKVGVMPVSGALTRAIPRYTFQGLCNHVLYDHWCTKVKEDFEYDGTGSVQTGNTFDLSGLEAAKGDGWATGGYAVMDLDYRLVLKQTGDTLKLLLPFNTDTDGQDVSVFAGCDHSLATCKDKFDNVINYGGFPFVPTKNPFSTGLD